MPARDPGPGLESGLAGAMIGESDRMSERRGSLHARAVTMCRQDVRVGIGDGGQVRDMLRGRLEASTRREATWAATATGGTARRVRS